MIGKLKMNYTTTVRNFNYDYIGKTRSKFENV